MQRLLVVIWVIVVYLRTAQDEEDSDSVYLEYYDLKEKPFAITPDPDFVYLNDTFRQGFNEIVYAVHNRLGLAVLIGEVGTGKTTLARAILRELRESCKTAYIINPALSFEELVAAILRDLGETDLPETREGLLTRLNEFLLDAYHQGDTVVVFIDEAHLLQEKDLEKVRLLSNLETNKEKLLQMVLIGQPELGKILSKRSMRQLRDRVMVQVGLEPLKPGEVRDYIYHRLSVAGDSGALTFTNGACKKIAKLSGGIPRRINLLCDRALLAAYAKRSFEVTPRLVRQAAKDINRKFPEEVIRRERRGIGWSGWVLIFLLLCIGGVFYINQTFFGYSPKDVMRELLSVGRSVPQVIKTEGPKTVGSPVSPSNQPYAAVSSGAEAHPKSEVQKQPSEKPVPVPAASREAGSVRGAKESEGRIGTTETPKGTEHAKSPAGVKKRATPTAEKPKAEGGKNPAQAAGHRATPPAKPVAKKKKGSSAAATSSPSKEKGKATVQSSRDVNKQKGSKVVKAERETDGGKSAGKKGGREKMEVPVLSPETEKAVEREITRWKTAMEDLDEATLKAMYSPSLYKVLEERLSLMRAGGEERDIRIENLKITPLVNGDVRVTFEQQYLSMRYSDYGLTTLVFHKKDGRWIVVGYRWKSL